LWINKPAQAEEEVKNKVSKDLENDQVKLLTKDNFREICLHLKRNSSVSWQLLQYMAYLDAEGISVDFIISLMGLTREELQKHVNELKRMSLVSVGGARG